MGGQINGFLTKKLTIIIGFEDDQNWYRKLKYR